MEIPLEYSGRYVKRQFEKAMGKSITKILAEPITNADDSYKRLAKHAQAKSTIPIRVVVDRNKRKFKVVDQAEGLTEDEMKIKLAKYGEESGDHAKGMPTRSLFGKGLRDVMFTQTMGSVKSIKDGKSHICKFKWKQKNGDQKPVLDIRRGPKVDRDLRESWGIEENGILVEFKLRDDIPLPQHYKLVEKLQNFYMLRLINSDASREVTLESRYEGRSEKTTLSYTFPEGELLKRIRFDFGYNDYEISVDGEIKRAKDSMVQGEAGYEEREGGLLIVEENDAVLDLTLFGFDDDPYARRLFGLVKLRGAGKLIRDKLNQKRPEELLTETRDGFDKKHPFYVELKKQVDKYLKPIVEEETRALRKERDALSEETQKKHRQALQKLNEVYKDLVGGATPGFDTPGTLKKPRDGLEFFPPEITITKNRVSPTTLLIDPDIIPDKEVLTLASNSPKIVVDPKKIQVLHATAKNGVILKIIRLTGLEIGSGTASATGLQKKAELEVTVVEAPIVIPKDGLEFSPDHIRVHPGSTRELNLYIATEKVPTGTLIDISPDKPEVVRIAPKSQRIHYEATANLTREVALYRVPITGAGIGKTATVRAIGGGYTAEAFVEVVSKKEQELTGPGGKFKDWKFESLDRKLQTYFSPDGTILINTNDPTNKKYFGDEPYKSVEVYTHCQIRLSDLILDECLQVMVSEALNMGCLERKFPNNPEIDIRNYVSEKKFELGHAIHDYFVDRQNLQAVLENPPKRT